MQFYEVKIKIERTLETGAQKKVAETYALDALSFTEAEARITQEMQPYITGDFDVTHIKRANYHEFEDNGGDRCFVIKFNLLTIDEKTGAEKKAPLYLLLRDASLDKAKENAHKYMHGSVTDYEISYIKETDIVDVFLNTDPDHVVRHMASDPKVQQAMEQLDKMNATISVHTDK